MLSTILAENYLLVRLAMIVGLIVTIVVAALLVRAHGRGQRIATYIAVAGLVVVIALTLTPDTNPLDGSVCNLQPYSFYSDAYNIVLFGIPAIFAVVAIRRPVIVLLSGILLSGVIELAQYWNPWFGRRCDIDDWLANSIGTLVGVLIAVVVIAVAGRLRRRRFGG